MNKTLLIAGILAQLRQELALQSDAAALARDEAISEESRPENKWDTHSQEAAYLAEGQAKLAMEIRESLDTYASLALPTFNAGDPIALGAVVELEAIGRPGRSTWYFLGPRAGGRELAVEGRDILVLTPLSPLGRQLIGRRTGETVSTPGRGGVVQQRIARVE